MFTAPASCSDEKVESLRVRGATVEICPLVPYATDERHFQRRAKTIATEMNTLWTNQFDNLANSTAHYKTTGPEIYQQTQGKINAFVSSSGTGGTIGGVSTYLKEKNPNIKCVLLDPPGTGIIVENGEVRGKTDQEKAIHAEKLKALGLSNGSTVLEGIGSGRLYENVRIAKVDEMILIPDESAIQMAKFVLKHDGLFVGGSSGANLLGAYLCGLKMGPGNIVVTCLCDSGDRYISKIFNDQFVKSKEYGMDCCSTPTDLSFTEICKKLNAF